MIINIKPIDVLFFRDSKPFTRGSEHFSKSIFPPYPQTLYGALRTKVLEVLGCDFEKFRNGELEFKNQDLVNKNGGVNKIAQEVGSVSQVGSFSLKGPLLLKNHEVIYLKLPADVKKVENTIKIMTPFNWGDYGVEADFELSCYPHIITHQPVEDLEGYIFLRNFIDFYLLNQCSIQENQIKKTDEIYGYEMRTGVAIKSETHTTEEGKLYTMGYVRLKDGWSFYAVVENLSSLPQKGIIKLGGGNRVCEYEKLVDNNDPFGFYFQEKIDEKTKEKIKDTKKFKLIFLTPTIFYNGWLSNRIKRTKDGYELQLDNIKAKLITAAVNKPEYVSGWDIANQKPKQLKKVVPAGSVYYFELLEGSIDELFKKLNFQNFSDENPNLGFGLTIIGGI